MIKFYWNVGEKKKELFDIYLNLYLYSIEIN